MPPYAYNAGGGVPGPQGGPGTGLLGGIASSFFNAIGTGGYGGGGGYSEGGYGGGSWGVGGCCHPFWWHPWHVNWGCPCAYPHPYAYPRPAYHPYPPAYQQEQNRTS